MKNAPRNAGIWRNWEISMCFPFAASVVLQSALPRFFGRSFFAREGSFAGVWGQEDSRTRMRPSSHLSSGGAKVRCGGTALPHSDLPSSVWKSSVSESFAARHMVSAIFWKRIRKSPSDSIWRGIWVCWCRNSRSWAGRWF